MSFTDAQIEAARAVIYELAGMRFADKTIRAALEAAERAESNARLEVLGGKAPRGGLVGNRRQRRAGLRPGAR